MKSMKLKLVLLILVVGMLSSCGGQPTETPASAPTEAVVPATEAPTNPPAPTDTVVVPTNTAQPQPTKAPTTDPGTQVQAGTVSFSNDVAPIFKSRCANCHGGNQTQEGLSLLSYADLMKGSDNGPVITPGDPGNSLLVDLVSSQQMPKRGPKLTPDQIQIIVDWVTQGALDN